MSENEEMRVWVGCLGCYNAGHLLGEWFDAIDAPTDMADFNGSFYPGQLAVRGAHTSDDSECPHEELWVFDHEGFGGLLKGECSPMEAQRIAELVADVDDLDAFKAFMDNEGGDVDQDAIERFQEAYCGLYDSERDYAMELAEETGAFSANNYVRDWVGNTKDVDLSSMWPFTCIDWDHAWNELRIGGDNYSVPTFAPTYGVYIFRNV